jgi:hypothetical protein
MYVASSGAANIFLCSDNGGGYFTGPVQAASLNTTSDANKKTNISKIGDALSIIQQLNGVRFNWKSDNSASAGLIAQDVQRVLPELVNDTGEFLTLNYNGVVGALVEAVKELAQMVSDLTTQLSGNK